MARRVLAFRRMDDRNGRARSALESMKRRQLEARRLSESSPIAGLGTYQVMRPARGREFAGPRLPQPRPPRLPNGSDAFGVIEAPSPQAVVPPVAREEERTMVVARRIYRAEVAPPPDRFEPRRSAWILPISLSLAISALLIAVAIILR